MPNVCATICASTVAEPAGRVSSAPSRAQADGSPGAPRFTLPMAVVSPADSAKSASVKLTPAQRELVEQNLPLVGLHLRKRAATVGPPTRGREAGDLFQEGALALVRAARSFRPERDGPFAAYALPRIRAAVHQALHQGFQTIRVPVARQTSPKGEDLPRCDSLGDAEPIARAGRTDSPDDDFLPASAAPDHAGPAGGHAGEDFAERYRRSLDASRCQWLSTRRHHAACAKAIDRIIEERMRVPDEAWRTSLETIARSVGVAKSTVLRWERQLYTLVRRRLSAQYAVGRNGKPTATNLADAGSPPRFVSGKVLDPASPPMTVDRPSEPQARLLWTLLAEAGRDPHRMADELLARRSIQQARSLRAPASCSEAPAARCA